MNLKDCYEAFGGNFDEVLGRLRREPTVQKFAFKFLDDKSYDLLISSLEQGNSEEAFRAAHTIKGMCQNLGFNTLLASSAELTEALRSGLTPEAGPLCERVKEDYGRTVTAIRSFQEGMST